MRKNLKPICIIPARAGSKRIKNKNIKKFNNKPIIYYSIKAALKSNCFEKVIVSTDSLKIKKISEKLGATVPFIRPKHLSTDKCPTRPVIKHALSNFISTNYKPEFICFMTATAPLINYRDIIESFKLIKKNNVNFVVSINRFSYPIQRSLIIDKKGFLNMWKKKFANYRSQDLNTFYHDSGHFCWASSNAILKEKFTFSNKTLPYILPSYKAIDIDTMEDWKLAQILQKK
jgi:pseudaminic acid cytidylyltransferase